jgi:putative toxin-antitoxin system antitoxin component (TIGR02293 family)
MDGMSPVRERMLSRAALALGSSDRAGRWIEKPNRALGGRRPVDVIATPGGAEAVERILGRIEHGVYS